MAAGAGADAADGRGLSRTVARPAADHRDDCASRKTNFKQTLERGLRLLDRKRAVSIVRTGFPGEVAFRLYDTYGFPLDLTEDVLRGRGRKVAIAGSSGDAQQREEARKSWVGSGEAATERSLVRAARGGRGRRNSSATRPRAPRASSWRSSRAARAPRRECRRRGRHHRQPDPILWRVGRPSWRYRRRVLGRRRRIRGPRHGQGRRATLHVHHGTMAHGLLKMGDAVELQGRWRTAPPPARQPFRHAPPAPGVAPPARRACHAKGIAGRARPVALRFQPSAAGEPREDVAAIEAEINARIRGEQRGAHRLLTPGPSDRPKARWRSSARNTARRCGSSRWAAHRCRRRPFFGRALRRDPCPPHR